MFKFMKMKRNIHRLAGEDEKRRIHAAVALGRLGLSDAIPALGTALANEKKYGSDQACQACINALAAIGGEAAFMQIGAFILRGAPTEWADMATKALAGMDYDRALRELLGVLSHEESFFRSNAAEALGLLGDERATEPIMRALEREVDPSDLPSFAHALGRLGDPRAVSSLLVGLAICDDDLSDVQKALVAALCAVGEPQWKKYVDTESGKIDWVSLAATRDLRVMPALVRIARRCTIRDADKDALVLEAINKCDREKLIPVLLKDFQADPGPGVAWILGEIGANEAIPMLIKALRADNVKEVCEAACALGKLGASNAVEELKKLLAGLGDPRWGEYTKLDIRRAVENALASLGSVDTDSLLGRLNSHQDKWERLAAARILAKAGKTEAIGPILNQISSEESHDAREGLEGVLTKLAKVAREKEVEILFEGLAGNSFATRMAAARSLKVVAWNNPKLIMEKWQQIHRMATARHKDEHSDYSSSDCHTDTAHVDYGIGMAFPISPPAPTGAAEDKVNRGGMPRQLASLMATFQDAGLHYDDRIAALKKLRDIKDARIIPGLLEVLETHNDGQVVRETANALGDFQTEEVCDALITAMKTHTHKPGVRFASAEALAKHGNPKAIPVLLEALLDPEGEWDTMVQLEACRSLGHYSDTAVVKHLLAVLEKGDTASLRQAAANSLSKIAKSSPDLVREHWNRIRKSALAPHRDDCSGPHSDVGIYQEHLEDVESLHQELPLGDEQATKRKAFRVCCPNPDCKKPLKVPLAALGKKAVCAVCKTQIALPENLPSQHDEDVRPDF